MATKEQTARIENAKTQLNRYLKDGSKLYFVKHAGNTFSVLATCDDWIDSPATIEDITLWVATLGGFRRSKHGLSVSGTGFNRAQHVTDMVAHQLEIKLTYRDL